MSSAENLVKLAQIEQALNKRWPENKIEPTLDRILALTDALGSPQFSYPTIHLAGTNGKTTTSRMIDQLLAELGYRVGRYTSPHLESFTERISIKGEPISPENMITTYNDIALYLDLIDSRQPHPISYFTKLLLIAGFLIAVTRLTAESDVDRTSFGVSALLIASGWLAGEVRAFFRLRLQLPLPKQSGESS